MSNHFDIEIADLSHESNEAMEKLRKYPLSAISALSSEQINALSDLIDARAAIIAKKALREYSQGLPS